MMDDAYLYIITALLPLSALMVVVQKNPYHALVIRGILGAVAALVYAVLGAADVALTEALVGTMLAITLYAVAVRSSLNMRLGLLQEDLDALEAHRALNKESLNPEPIAELADIKSSSTPALAELMGQLRQMLKKRHMRLELVPYPTLEAMEAGLCERDIHAICQLAPAIEPSADYGTVPACSIKTRIRRLYDLMQAELPILSTSLSHVNPDQDGAAAIEVFKPAISAAEEVHS
jgi:putative multicomponent Na+:H+ antiporter subunit B